MYIDVHSHTQHTLMGFSCSCTGGQALISIDKIPIWCKDRYTLWVLHQRGFIILRRRQFCCEVWHRLIETDTAINTGRHFITHTTPCLWVQNVKESCNRPGVAQRVPGGLGSQISWHSARKGGEVGLTHRPPLPQECSWYSFSLGAESTPGPWNGRRRYVTEKSSDTTGNRSRDRLTSRAAP